LAGDLSFCFDDVPVGSGKIRNISGKLTARHHVEPKQEAKP
jgi:hypothetical protein